MRLTLCAIAAATMLSACANLLSQKHAELAPTAQSAEFGETATLPAQLRVLTIKRKEGSFVSCAEPGPDVALSDTFKLVTAVTSERVESASDAASASSSSQRKGSLSGDLQSSTTALELAGRTQTVLLAREFLFRTCEAAANGWLEKLDVKTAHTGTLEQLTRMVAADAKKAETTAVLVAAGAAGPLDAKAILNAASAVREASLRACRAEFEACLSKPGADDKAKEVCRATHDNCIK
jgi:hypothetical protein